MLYPQIVVKKFSLLPDETVILLQTNIVHHELYHDECLVTTIYL